jgi:succinate dehydrogenase/fumarate reductase flavoprotein subunit
MRALLATYEAEAVPTLYDTAVVGLVSEGGAVVGIRARSGGQPLTVRARRGVVLASGSFNLNKDLTDAHFPVLSRYGAPLGTDASDGTGLLLAQGVGAATRGMDGVIGTASIYPPENLIKGIVVNKLGQRFVAEDSYHGRLAWFVERQPDHVAYLIVDEEIFDYPEKGSHKMLDGFLTVSEAETGLGLPEGSLEATLSEYNRDVADGVDRRFRKDAHWLKPLAAPLVAFDISIPSSDYHYISLGGVSTDNDGRVLAGDGRVVEGLYAAGAVAAHFPQNGAEYASGMSLGPGSFFGRRAGRHAAARRP